MIRIDDLVCDIASQEDHSFDNEVTDEPVEMGTNVTVNTIKKPIEIVIDGLISDYPLNPDTGTVLPNGDAQPGATPSELAKQKLLALRASGEPIVVIDSLGTWPNMVLEKLSIPRTPKTGFALQFKASFKELVIVTNERTVVPVSLPRAAALTNLGHRTSPMPPTNDPGTHSEDNRTALHKLLSGGASRLGYILPGDPGNPIGNSVPEP